MKYTELTLYTAKHAPRKVQMRIQPNEKEITWHPVGERPTYKADRCMQVEGLVISLGKITPNLSRLTDTVDKNCCFALTSQYVSGSSGQCWEFVTDRAADQREWVMAFNRLGANLNSTPAIVAQRPDPSADVIVHQNPSRLLRTQQPFKVLLDGALQDILLWYKPTPGRFGALHYTFERDASSSHLTSRSKSDSSSPNIIQLDHINAQYMGRDKDCSDLKRLGVKDDLCWWIETSQNGGKRSHFVATDSSTRDEFVIGIDDIMRNYEVRNPIDNTETFHVDLVLYDETTARPVRLYYETVPQPALFISPTLPGENGTELDSANDERLRLAQLTNIWDEIQTERFILSEPALVAADDRCFSLEWSALDTLHVADFEAVNAQEKGAFLAKLLEALRKHGSHAKLEPPPVVPGEVLLRGLWFQRYWQDGVTANQGRCWVYHRPHEIFPPTEHPGYMCWATERPMRPPEYFMCDESAATQRNCIDLDFLTHLHLGAKEAEVLRSGIAASAIPYRCSSLHIDDGRDWREGGQTLLATQAHARYLFHYWSQAITALLAKAGKRLKTPRDNPHYVSVRQPFAVGQVDQTAAMLLGKGMPVLRHAGTKEASQRQTPAMPSVLFYQRPGPDAAQGSLVCYNAKDTHATPHCLPLHLLAARDMNKRHPAFQRPSNKHVPADSCLSLLCPLEELHLEMDNRTMGVVLSLLAHLQLPPSHRPVAKDGLEGFEGLKRLAALTRWHGKSKTEYSSMEVVLYHWFPVKEKATPDEMGSLLWMEEHSAEVGNIPLASISDIFLGKCRQELAGDSVREEVAFSFINNLPPSALAERGLLDAAKALHLEARSRKQLLSVLSYVVAIFTAAQRKLIEVRREGKVLTRITRSERELVDLVVEGTRSVPLEKLNPTAGADLASSNDLDNYGDDGWGDVHDAPSKSRLRALHFRRHFVVRKPDEDLNFWQTQGLRASSPRLQTMLRQGRCFCGYAKKRGITRVRRVFLWYQPVHNSAGRLCWVGADDPRARATGQEALQRQPDPDCALPLESIREFRVGRQHELALREAADDLVPFPKQCFSIVGASLTLCFMADHLEHIVAWLFGLHSILSTIGGKVGEPASEDVFVWV